MEHGPFSSLSREDYVRMIDRGLDDTRRGAVVTDAEGRILAINRRACALLEVERNRVLGTRLEELFPILHDLDGKTLPRDERPSYRALRTRQALDPRIIGLGAPGSDDPLWMEISATPLFEGSETVCGVISTFVDATARVDEEMWLRTLSSVAEATDNGVVVCDLERKVRWCNPAFIRMTGYTEEEAFGQKPGDLLQCDDTDPRTIERMRQSLDAGEGFHEEVLNVMKSGQQRWIDLEVQPLYDALGRQSGWMGIKRDITERRRIETDLRRMTARATAHAEAVELALTRAEQLAREAQAASRAKDEFLRNTSHEIRTPLNGVLVAANLLADGLDQPEQVELLEMIRTSGERLLGLLDNVLQFARIAADEVTVLPQSLSLRSLADALDQRYRRRAEDQGIEWSVTTRPDLLPVVAADPRILERILSLLLDNAFGVAREGMVCLEVAAQPVDDAWELGLAVTDTGPGIAREHQELVFEPFRQVDGSTRRDREGMGLGLAIVSRLVTLLGGRLTLESREGGPTRFEIALRVGRSELDTGPPGATPQAIDDAVLRLRALRPRVLLVDGGGRLVTETLRSLAVIGARVDRVRAEHLDEATMADLRYDVVIVDEKGRTADDLPLRTGHPPVPIPRVLLRNGGPVREFDEDHFDAVLCEPVAMTTLAPALSRLCRGRNRIA